MSFCISLRYQQFGSATEILSQGIIFERENLGVNSITSKVLQRNIAYEKVHRECGFEYVGRGISSDDDPYGLSALVFEVISQYAHI